MRALAVFASASLLAGAASAEPVPHLSVTKVQPDVGSTDEDDRAGTEPRTTGRLESAPGGGAVVHDRVTTMYVEPDGTIHFHDKPDIDLHLHLPIPRLDFDDTLREVGDDLAMWYRDANAGTRYTPMKDVARHLTATPGACNDWADPWCDDAQAPESERSARQEQQTEGSIVGGTMDLSAYSQRKLIGDPYASRKTNLMDSTRDARLARGGDYRTEQLDRSAELARRALERLWQVERDPRARRMALFDMWDECDEGEGARGEAGARARALIIGWIRTHLRAGTPDAYTAAELRALHARQTSQQVFQPY